LSALSPWLAVAGLGAFHGVNPAMGWLFAAALGLHRKSRRTVLISLLPIAVGHALSVAVVAAVVVLLGIVVEPAYLRAIAGTALVGWALYHLARGARHRVRVGMQAGLTGLALWSFLMAGAHGAGLMLVPALIPLCLSGGVARSPATALAAVGLHTAAMLLVAGAIALAVYEWIGVAFLRRGWINLDRLWVGALLAAGTVLLVL
jgi:hypothetical protein